MELCSRQPGTLGTHQAGDMGVDPQKTLAPLRMSGLLWAGGLGRGSVDAGGGRADAPRFQARSPRRAQLFRQTS